MGYLLGHMWMWVLAAFIIGAIIGWMNYKCDRG